MDTTAVRRRRRLTATLASFLLLFGVVTGTQVARPQFARAAVASGDVIFARDEFSACPNNEQIAQYNGSTETDLSDCTTGDQMPAVSPDGSRIVYQGGWNGGSGDPTENGLYVMNSDGSGKTQITIDCVNYSPPSTCGTSYTDENPSWSPDGTKIVFTRQSSSGYAIDTVNADGTGLTILVTVGSGGFLLTGGPTSWYGTKILYTFYTSGADQLYAYDTSTLTSSQVDSGSTSGADYDPTWSPDGSKIYFDNGSDVWVVAASGGTPTQVTDSSWYGGSNYEPTVSSDGSTLAYDHSSQIYTIPSNANPTTNRQPGSSLTSSGNGDNEPAYVLASWPPGNSTVSLDEPSVSDTPYTRQITVHLSTSGIGSFQYGWSQSNDPSTGAPNTSYLQSTTNLSTGLGTLNYLGVYSGSGTTWNGGTTPNTNWYLWVRSVNTGGSPNSWGTPLKVHTPKAPAWIGLGDSYSSGWVQSSSHFDCVVEDSTCSVTTWDDGFSWLHSAVADFNSAEHVPTAWQIIEYDDAVGGASTSSFGDSSQTPGTYAWATSGTQANDLVVGLGSQPDSWNVVSVTGGGIDAGLSSTLLDWYAYVPNYTDYGDHVWSITSASRCPDTTTMYHNLTTGSPTGNDTITTNLQGIVHLAAAESPAVRVLSVGYPEILDSSDVCQSDGSGTYGAGSVIAQLNDDHSELTGSNVKYVNLVTAFGSTPISAGDIQETYDFGYPHPSSTGQALIGTAASNVATGGTW